MPTAVARIINSNNNSNHSSSGVQKNGKSNEETNCEIKKSFTCNHNNKMSGAEKSSQLIRVSQFHPLHSSI